jgi:hypothetical protein
MSLSCHCVQLVFSYIVYFSHSTLDYNYFDCKITLALVRYHRANVEVVNDQDPGIVDAQ